MRPERITIVQLARFGDLIQSSPLIQRLREESGEEAELRLVVESRAVAAAKLLDGVDEVIGVELNEAARLAAGGDAESFKRLDRWSRSWSDRAEADRLILLNQGNLPEAIASLVPASMRIGPMRGSQHDTPHRLLTQALSNRRFNPLHLTEIWGSYGARNGPLNRPKLAFMTTGTSLAKYTSDEVLSNKNTLRYALNLGAGSAGRRLSGAKVAGLARALLSNDRNLLYLLGTGPDRSKTDELIASLPEQARTRAIDCVGKTSLNELADLLSSMDLLISSDTGTLQLSAATGTKSLGLFFGGANPVETGAWSEGAVALVRHDTLGTGDEPSDKDMRWAAEIAEAITADGLHEEWNHESSTCALLVARPAPVGLVYTPVRGEVDSVGVGRQWRGFIEAILGRESSRNVSSDAFGDAFDTGDMERAQRLMNLLVTLRKRNGAADPAWTDEELWIARIAGAFPEVAVRWAGMKSRKEAGWRIEA